MLVKLIEQLKPAWKRVFIAAVSGWTTATAGKLLFVPHAVESLEEDNAIDSNQVSMNEEDVL